MSGLLHYMWNCNRKRFIISFCILIFIMAILCVQMNVQLSGTSDKKQLELFFVIVILYIFSLFLSFIQTVATFSKLLKNPLIRLSGVSGWKIVWGIVLFLFAVMIVWEVVADCLLYILGILAIPGSTLFQLLTEIKDMTRMEWLLNSLIEMLKVESIMVQILFLIVLMKWLIKKRKLQFLFIIVSFFILNAIFKGIYVGLGKVTTAYEFTKKVMYLSGEGLEIGMYAGTTINIYNVSFACIISVACMYATAYIIDNKLEA
ncbi:hypothetical protein ACRS6Y_02435 [Bacillus cytotoxicus]|uniref:ABC transporter, permease n=1 Tax=Bacillus cytotoxicus (strain DSM 22905 / CIP 110041 / 391-98 / NVH 391-98) TaxID=315749 RepID=A7GMP7_BACCN|nr:MULTISPECIES: hypothetical protein [Bacillus cereus group]ABS21405.1 ABC transporter, permease [Bacillus cytotoxicus NVH 391-98]AWC44115.1 hypothetical protein CG479_006080 [Bacillus cytotoxicus]MDH2862766.1 hypothetical protein [Bacillus cytotoxicus]MDH2883305.1 hypothetical protein [Bacillus cytotoxicus]MDH2886707.1 hypothetical protein [Bacillus cytotoxicus]